MSQILPPFTEALSRQLGFPLEPSKDGAVFLSMEEGALMIQPLESSRQALLYATIGVPTPFRRREVLTALMEANLFLLETHGAALSYDARNEMVGLNLLLPLDGLSTEAFVNTVDGMVQSAAAWRDRLREMNRQAEDRVREAQSVLEGPQPGAGREGAMGLRA